MPDKPAASQTPGGISDAEYFQFLVQGVTDYAIYMLSAEGLVSSWNSGAQAMKGYSADEIKGRHFSIFYTPEDREAGGPARALETARREGKFEAEGWRVRKDGTRFFASVVIDAIYDHSGEFLGFAKITRDITERRKAQDILQESERQFRMLVGGVTDYALYMLNPQGNIASWNAGGERIKGYTREEILGQHFSRFYSEADRSAGRPERALSIAEKTGRYEEEGWRVRKDGSFFWASVVVDAIRDEDGRLVGFAKITRDITERRQAQTALEKVQRQLAESQKMDALGQLTGGVAHDFNNLLMVVSGHIHTLKRLAANDPSGLRATQAIELAAQRGAALTRQLLTFSRRQRVNPVPVGIAERIGSFREILVSGLGMATRLAIDIPIDAWPVKVDVGEFEIALINLVINARDAMPEGGTVTISAKNVVLEDNGEVASGNYVAISVEDTGVGIPDDVLSKVFDPFFTTKPVGKGTGLGLSQVHGFAHQAGGTVAIASALGKGTRITLYLPQATEELVSLEANGQATGRNGVGTVLLVEDNPEVASATAGLLEQLGYTVNWVQNADSALDALDANGIDVVFSDIVMPGRLDGLGLARTINERYPGLPVLLATGYSAAAQDAQNDFPILRKPYQIHELSRALAELKHRDADCRRRPDPQEKRRPMGAPF